MALPRRVATLSVHTSPLDQPGCGDAGGLNVYVTEVAKRLAERQLQLAISDKALDLLGNIGFDPVYGARPLKRAIQQQLENPLAREILEGKFQPGDTVAVDAAAGRLVFAKPKP